MRSLSLVLRAFLNAKPRVIVLVCSSPTSSLGVSAYFFTSLVPLCQVAHTRARSAFASRSRPFIGRVIIIGTRAGFTIITIAIALIVAITAAIFSARLVARTARSVLGRVGCASVALCEPTARRARCVEQIRVHMLSLVSYSQICGSVVPFQSSHIFKRTHCNSSPPYIASRFLCSISESARSVIWPLAFADWYAISAASSMQLIDDMPEETWAQFIAAPHDQAVTATVAPQTAESELGSESGSSLSASSDSIATATSVRRASLLADVSRMFFDAPPALDTADELAALCDTLLAYDRYCEHAGLAELPELPPAPGLGLGLGLGLALQSASTHDDCGGNASTSSSSSSSSSYVQGSSYLAAMLQVHLPSPTAVLRSFHHALSLDAVAAFARHDADAMQNRFEVCMAEGRLGTGDREGWPCEKVTGGRRNSHGRPV